MTIIERDPWRQQYFDGIDCPEDVDIPTDDLSAFDWNPRHRWIYDKYIVAQSQGLDCGKDGSVPQRYPVFCKPITNLRGMGLNIHVLHSVQDFERFCLPGHFWMTLLQGEHVSTDLAVIEGLPVWHRHCIGRPGAQGTFDYWTVSACGRDELTQYCCNWVRANLTGYTGMMNIETIGGRIIEAHLRFADQWPDLYGPGWIEAVVHLYARGEWAFADTSRKDGFSVALFGPHGRRYSHPEPDRVAAYRTAPGVSSVQITFHEDRPAGAHAMPPGGFRLAIVNAWDLTSGLRLRRRMARDFQLKLRSAGLEPVSSQVLRPPSAPVNNAGERSSTRRRD